MNAMEDHLLKLRPFPLADIGQVVSFLKDFLNAWYVQSVILCLAFYAFTPLPLLAQEETLSEKIISMVEELTGEDTEGGEAVLYQEKLHELIEDGVKINSADEQEISRLFFLSAFRSGLLPIILNEPEKYYLTMRLQIFQDLTGKQLK